jgi:hypothetical protein
MTPDGQQVLVARNDAVGVPGHGAFQNPF